jgi:hypothetical protein
MAYGSQDGQHPAEYASKSAHSHLINDPAVQTFLRRCHRAGRTAQTPSLPVETIAFEPVADNPIRRVLAVDSGYREIPLRDHYPAEVLGFFQFGALSVNLADLARLDRQPFTTPSAIAQLKQVRRLKLVLPVRHITLRDHPSLTDSIRHTLHRFLRRPLRGSSLMETLAWLIFAGYRPDPAPTWMLASCPHCEAHGIHLDRAAMTAGYTFTCERCGGELLLTDVLRLHERIQDRLGGSDILGYVGSAVEQLLLVHIIRRALARDPRYLAETLLLRDGPLAFFGPTLSLQRAMRALVGYLFDAHTLYLAGLEKSGAFVDYAHAIDEALPAGRVILLDTPTIHRHILPGKVDTSSPYGKTTYYSHKLIVKTPARDLHVVTLPAPTLAVVPGRSDYRHLAVILTNLAQLRCGLYEHAVLPIALVNRAVSLSRSPGAQILQRFAATAVGEEADG